MIRVIKILGFFFFLMTGACSSKPTLPKVSQDSAASPKPELKKVVVTENSCREGNLENCVTLGDTARSKGKITTAEGFYHYACEEKHWRGCVRLAELSLKTRTPPRYYRGRAKAYYLKACNGGDLDACYTVATSSRLNIAPYNKNQLLTKACELGEPRACIQMAQRLERYYGRTRRAQQYYSVACKAGYKKYCQQATKPIRPKRKRKKVGPKKIAETTPAMSAPVPVAREAFLRKFFVSNNKKQFYQVSAGPCSESGCPFHINLWQGRKRLKRVALPWQSKGGPLERGGSSAIAAGEDNQYVGTFARRLRIGPSLNAVLVMQEAGYDNVKHRQDVYLAVDGDLVRIPRGHLTPKGEPTQSLFAVVIGKFSNVEEARRARRQQGTRGCTKGFKFVKTDIFPKVNAGKVLWAYLSKSKPRAEDILNTLTDCENSPYGEIVALL